MYMVTVHVIIVLLLSPFPLCFHIHTENHLENASQHNVKELFNLSSGYFEQQQPPLNHYLYVFQFVKETLWYLLEEEVCGWEEIC